MIRKNIPNFLTLCNLLCGCLAIMTIRSLPDFATAFGITFLIGCSCLFDFLDGLVARLLKAHSEIGKELDSLADMVSFGVVPSLIMFRLIDASIRESGNSDLYRDYYPYFGLLIAVFSAIRLAKFNIDTRQKDYFIGLPTPANAILIVALPLNIIGGNDAIHMDNTALSSLLFNPYFLILLSIASSLMLIAPLALIALKFKNFSWAENQMRYILILLSLVLLIVFQLAGIPLIIILYVLVSMINNIISKNKI